MDRSKKISMDQTFLQKLTDAVFANLNNDQFGVEELAKEVGLSRSQIHRKLHRINGKSVTKFIREIRLEEAHRLIEQEVGTASEVAYQVGFSSPTYFTKCFHEYFGYTPGEVKKIESETVTTELSDKEKPIILPIYGTTFKSSETQDDELDKRDFLKQKILPYLIIAGLAIIVIVFILSYRLDRKSFVNVKKSIAVLPFKTITKDSTSTYIADGIREDILNNLGKIKGLEVGSSTSSETYRTSNKRIPEIAKELGVDVIMEGSAQKFGDKIRISIKLIDGKTDNQLWQENYDGSFEDIFTLYTEIAEDVAAALQVVIIPEEKEQIASTFTIDASAYDYILQAREEKWKYWNSGNVDTIALNRAEMLYKRAIKLDPNYAPAWWWLGSIYLDHHINTDEYYTEDYLDSTFWYSDKAITIDPKEGGAYFLMGLTYHIKGDIDLAINNYEKARSLSQHDAIVLSGALWRLGMIGIFKKDYLNGIMSIRRGVAMAKGSPKYYQKLLYNLGYAYIFAGAYNEAAKYYIEVLNLNGNCRPLSYLYYCQGDFQTSLDQILSSSQSDSSDVFRFYALANTYLQLSDFDKAVKYYREFRKRSVGRGLNEISNLYREGFALIQLGYKEEGDELIDEQLTQLNKRKELGRPDGYAYHLAAIAAYRGEEEHALQYLRDYNQGVFFPYTYIIPISFSQYDILFKNLWENEEFKEIIRNDQEEKEAVRIKLREMEKQGDLDM